MKHSEILCQQLFHVINYSQKQAIREGIIQLLCSQNFPKNSYFSRPDTHTFLCVSRNVTYQFFGNFLWTCSMDDPKDDHCTLPVLLLFCPLLFGRGLGLTLTVDSNVFLFVCFNISLVDGKYIITKMENPTDLY